MTYEEIVQRWQKAKLPANIFSGNLLTVLTSEISKIEGINVSYHRTHELLENEYVAGYTGDIRDLFSVLNNRTLADFYNNALKTDRRSLHGLSRSHMRFCSKHLSTNTGIMITVSALDNTRITIIV